MVVAGVGGAAARREERAITARVEDSNIFETPSRGSSTASAVLSSVCLSVDTVSVCLYLNRHFM